MKTPLSILVVSALLCTGCGLILDLDPSAQQGDGAVLDARAVYDGTEEIDAGTDANEGLDAGSDANEGLDAGSDANEGLDAGSDANEGLDAGPDANDTGDAGLCVSGTARDCGVFACGPGVQACVDEAWTECTALREPAEETCNRVDDDCDGSTDEGGVCSRHCVPLDWDGHVYLICEDEKNWEDAREECRDFDGGYDLVSFGSEEEHDAVSTAAGPGRYWIGLADQRFEGLRWVGDVMLTYTSWAADEPNDLNSDGTTGADCVSMATEGELSVWRDRSCGQSYNYICEGVAR